MKIFVISLSISTFEKFKVESLSFAGWGPEGLVLSHVSENDGFRYGWNQSR